MRFAGLMSVHDAFLEGAVERPAHLEADLQHVGHRQEAFRLRVGREVAPGDQLHGDVAGVLPHHRVEDGDDVRVLELSRERGLVEELRAVHGAELGVAEHFGLDGLERHFPAGKGVPGQVHRAGGSLA